MESWVPCQKKKKTAACTRWWLAEHKRGKCNKRASWWVENQWDPTRSERAARVHDRFLGMCKPQSMCSKMCVAMVIKDP
jgi:hypothetical protein